VKPWRDRVFTAVNWGLEYLLSVCASPCHPAACFGVSLKNMRIELEFNDGTHRKSSE
jgi:hypothetical protein